MKLSPAMRRMLERLENEPVEALAGTPALGTLLALERRGLCAVEALPRKRPSSSRRNYRATLEAR